jgi:hypothetical protein
VWGHNSGFYDHLLEEGKPVPPDYLQRPRLHPALQIYWDAFWELSADRQIGMAIGRIPFTAIDRYAVRYGIEEVDEFDTFRNVIRSMDAEFRDQTTPKSAEGKGAQASVTDTQGVVSILGRLKERQEQNGDT